MSATGLLVLGVDLLDGTPVLDIKPYVPAFDTVQNPCCGWLEGKAALATGQRSDARFAQGDD